MAVGQAASAAAEDRVRRSCGGGLCATSLPLGALCGPPVGGTLANAWRRCWPDGGLTALGGRGRQYAACHDRDVACCRHDRSATAWRRLQSASARSTASARPPPGACSSAPSERHARRRALPVPVRRPVAGLRRARQGAEVWDVDGNEYLDFHNGFGVMCVGHANPVIAAAVKAQMDDGTHFAAPDRGLDRRRRGAATSLGSPPLALHELRHRVDDGRDPPRARPRAAAT